MAILRDRRLSGPKLILRESQSDGARSGLRPVFPEKCSLGIRRNLGDAINHGANRLSS